MAADPRPQRSRAVSLALAPGALTLVSGPAGSGKSLWAEHLAHGSNCLVVYLATGPELPDDHSWQRRLQRHRLRRPPGWLCREVGEHLATGLGRLHFGELALVDSLGTWVAALLGQEEADWQASCAQLQEAISTCPAPVLMVCEEVGWGVVPATAAGGRFRERLAALQQRLTARADAAWLVLQGRALDLLVHSLPVPETP